MPQSFFARRLAVAASVLALVAALGAAAGPAAASPQCLPGRLLGCDQPPVKRYRVGEKLPAHVVYVPVPLELDQYLAPPEKHLFAIVDGDLLLLAMNRRVVDAFPTIEAARARP